MPSGVPRLLPVCSSGDVVGDDYREVTDLLRHEPDRALGADGAEDLTCARDVQWLVDEDGDGGMEPTPEYTSMR